MIRPKLFVTLLSKQKLVMKYLPQMKLMKAQQSLRSKRNTNIKKFANINPFGRKKEKKNLMANQKQIQKMKRKVMMMMLLQTLGVINQIFLTLNSLKVIQKKNLNRDKLRKQQARKNLMNH